MGAAKLDLTIEQGATFRKAFTLKNSDTLIAIDLTGWTIEAKIRKRFADAAALVTFTVAISNQGTNPGEFTMSLTATQTSALPYDDKWYYDVEALKPDTDKDRILQGRVTVSPEVTK